eukprot:1107340-Rhodomonas_salina.1
MSGTENRSPCDALAVQSSLISHALCTQQTYSGCHAALTHRCESTDEFHAKYGDDLFLEDVE